MNHPKLPAPCDEFDRTEHWVSLARFPQFEVSNYGRVRKIVDRKIKKLTSRHNGRLVTRLSDHRPRTLAVDKLVAGAFLGPRPPAHVVAHKDGNLSNNAADNLEYRPRRVILEANEVRHRATLNGRPKLLGSQAREIRERALAGEPGIKLAREFGVTPATVSQIKHGKKWRNPS